MSDLRDFQAIALTGPRAEKLANLDMRVLALALPAVKDALRAMIDAREVVVFCGLATGFDLLGGGAALQLRDDGLPVEVVACLPYPSFGDGWKDVRARMWQEKIIDRASHVERTSRTDPKNHEDAAGMLMKRNAYMAGACTDALICDAGLGGGTAATIRMLEREGKPMVDCWPAVRDVLGLKLVNGKLIRPLEDPLAATIDLFRGKVVEPG